MSEEKNPRSLGQGIERCAATEGPAEGADCTRIHEHPRRSHGLKVQRERLGSKLASERARTVAALFQTIKLLDSFEAPAARTEYLEFKWKFQMMAETLSALDPDVPADLGRFIELTQEIKHASLRLAAVAEALAGRTHWLDPAEP